MLIDWSGESQYSPPFQKNKYITPVTSYYILSCFNFSTLDLQTYPPGKWSASTCQLAGSISKKKRYENKKKHRPGQSAGALFGMVKKWPFERLLVTSKYKIKKVTDWIAWEPFFLNSILVGSGHAKEKNDHPRTTPSLMCFFWAAKNVLRPKRETKGLHGSCKIPFISDQKNQLPKALPSMLFVWVSC